MWGWRLAEALNVGTVAGILIATAAMFWSNRLIPAGLPGREEWDIRVFFLVWTLSGAFALWRCQGTQGQNPRLPRSRKKSMIESIPNAGIA
jgi:uncharacterized iron-regulated membrane protein